MIFDFDLMFRGLIILIGTAALIILFPLIIMGSAIIFGLVLLGVVRFVETIRRRIAKQTYEQRKC